MRFWAARQLGNSKDLAKEKKSCMNVGEMEISLALSQGKDSTTVWFCVYLPSTATSPPI
jgi:hypothetical protein